MTKINVVDLSESRITSSLKLTSEIIVATNLPHCNLDICELLNSDIILIVLDKTYNLNLIHEISFAASQQNKLVLVCLPDDINIDKVLKCNVCWFTYSDISQIEIVVQTISHTLNNIGFINIGINDIRMLFGHGGQINCVAKSGQLQSLKEITEAAIVDLENKIAIQSTRSFIFCFFVPKTCDLDDISIAVSLFEQIADNKAHIMLYADITENENVSVVLLSSNAENEGITPIDKTLLNWSELCFGKGYELVV